MERSSMQVITRALGCIATASVRGEEREPAVTTQSYILVTQVHAELPLMLFFAAPTYRHICCWCIISMNKYL